MEKNLAIEGMSCMHCVKRVKEALESVEGVVAADVSLESESAVVRLKGAVSDERMKEAVDAAGYKVTSIS